MRPYPMPHWPRAADAWAEADYVLAILVVDSDLDRIAVCLDVLSETTMNAAMQLVVPCARDVVGHYALFCARLGMTFKHTLARGVDAQVRAYRAFHKRHAGVAWPLPVCVHPVMNLSADDVFVMTATEFLPAL